jgi:hypothetical protein
MLLKDSELRFRIASNAYEFVQNFHNRQIVAEKYATALGPFLNYRAPEIRFADRIESLLEYKEMRDTLDTFEATVKDKETRVRGPELVQRANEFKWRLSDSQLIWAALI